MQSELNHIEGLKRIENVDKSEMSGIMADLTRAVYPHDDLFDTFCPVQGYINCPPELVFEYMSDANCLAEWTYSMREFKKIDDKLFIGKDKIGENTDIYFKVESNKEALTVDYHCAWDQGEELWMIYLNRIICAEKVLGKPGSIVFWQNCRHKNYFENPFPEKAPVNRPWVGNFWDLFYAGHKVELENLTKILEYRYEKGLPIGPLKKEGLK